MKGRSKYHGCLIQSPMYELQSWILESWKTVTGRKLETWLNEHQTEVEIINKSRAGRKESLSTVYKSTAVTDYVVAQDWAKVIGTEQNGYKKTGQRSNGDQKEEGSHHEPRRGAIFSFTCAYDKLLLEKPPKKKKTSTGNTKSAAFSRSSTVGSSSLI